MAHELLDPRLHLPTLYKDIREIDVLSNAQEYVLAYIYDEYLKILSNQFVLTADTEGVARFEKVLGITVNYSIDLETRRQRVLSKMATSTIFTLKILKQNLKEMCDNGEFILSMDYDSFFMDIKVRMGKKGMLDVLYDLLYTMLPAHVGIYIHNHLPVSGSAGMYTAAALRIKKIYRGNDALTGKLDTRLSVSPALSARAKTREVLTDGVRDKVSTGLAIQAGLGTSVATRKVITDSLSQKIKSKQELQPALAVAVAHIIKP